MIIALPNHREIDTLYALRTAGLAISTVIGKRRCLNIAHPPLPMVKNVVRMRSGVDQIFDFARRPM